MGVFALVLSVLAGASIIFSFLSALGLPAEGPLFGSRFDWSFWILLAIGLLVGAVACLLSRGIRLDTHYYEQLDEEAQKAEAQESENTSGKKGTGK